MTEEIAPLKERINNLGSKELPRNQNLKELPLNLNLKELNRNSKELLKEDKK